MLKINPEDWGVPQDPNQYLLSFAAFILGCIALRLIWIMFSPGKNK